MTVSLVATEAEYLAWLNASLAEVRALVTQGRMTNDAIPRIKDVLDTQIANNRHMQAQIAHSRHMQYSMSMEVKLRAVERVAKISAHAGTDRIQQAHAVQQAHADC